MNSGLHFLIAAKRCEIDALRQLALTSALVNVTARLIHGLQRERGLSNLFLGSQGQGFKEPLEQQIRDCERTETELRLCLGQLDSESARVDHGARLFSRIAYVLHGLDALPALREQVAQLAWTPRQTTEALVRLVAGLLAVVFEAADGASDPQISRKLVAMFNFMQGKEFAGQERALGSALFASALGDTAEQQRLLHLIDSQDRCLQLFAEFGSAESVALWSALEASPPSAGQRAELERLRRVLCTAADGATLDARLSKAWFDACSARMDRMKMVEDRLALVLQQICENKTQSVLGELQSFELLLAREQVPADPLSFFTAPPPEVAQPYGHQLERSILDLVHEQSQRLQSISDELDTVRASLNERKLVERAKGILMAHRRLSEAEAHKALRQMAMNQNRRMIEVAESVLAMAEVLG
jgi:hypothetical protein